MNIGVLFPGQGSQFIGMGKEFVESRPECAEIFNIAESVCDFPLRQFCFHGPIEELTRAAILQPAITATNLVCFQALRSCLPESVKIAGYAGHSLGEYSALCAAGVISVQDAVRLVERRGYFMEREGNKRPGVMRAILGLDINEVEAAVNNYRGAGIVTVANYNTPQQIVISGSEDALDEVGAVLAGQGAKVIPLNVSVANHSPLVADAIPDFAAFMAGISFSQPDAPVYFNVTAEPLDDPRVVKDVMARQIASRVRWFESINRMVADGIDTFIEVGPKNVLKGMIRKIVPKGADVTAHQFDTPEALQACLEKLAVS